MILGTISPAFAAGLEDPFEPEQRVETELIARDGKLRGRLVVPRNAQVQTRSAGLFRAPAKAPAFDQTTVKVNIVKHGIGTNPFNFDAVFGTAPDTKVTLINCDTDETQEATFNKDTQSVTFGNPVSMEDMTNYVYGIEFEGTNVAGKITFDESAPVYSGGGNIATFTLDLYQVRNTDVVVTTKTADGTEVTNPTTEYTKGQIKLTAGTVTETIGIPAGNDATETVTRINKRNKDEINKGVAFTIEGTKNGVLVDKNANKVYKPEVKVDPDGLKPTEITFTEKNVAETVEENGGLDPVTIKVWKDDTVDWKKGVAPKTTNTDARELVQQLLDNAEVTDLSSRSSANSGKFEGKLQVKFGDGSTLEVEKQMLIVSEHIVTLNPKDPDAPKEEDLPDDKIEVRFLASTGVESITTTGKTYVKPGTTFKDKDFPQEKDITFKEGYKGPVTWTPADRTVKKSSPAFLKRQRYFRFTATATKETTADKVKALGGLKGVDFAAWVGDLEELTDATAKSNFWKKGVAANTTDNTKKATIDAALAEATVEDTTEPQKRTTDAKGTFPGTLKVRFKDGSVYVVNEKAATDAEKTNIEQKLYVYDKKDVVPTDPTQPTPEDAVVVTYNKGDGVEELQGTGKTLVKSGETLTDDDFPTATLEEGHKDLTWSGQTPGKPEDYTVTENNKVFTATAGKTVVPTDPDKPNPGKDQVTVTFLQGEHGTLTGIGSDGKNVTGAEKLAFNVKKTATWKDMAKYIPTAVAEKEWKVADPAWDPQIPAEGTTVTAGTYTAQYADDKTTTKNSEDYDPHYIDQSGNPGTTVTVPAPTFTKKGEQGTVPAPTDKGKKTKFAKNDGTQTNVTVNPDTGAITVVIPSDAKVGDTITIPVDVTYPDESTETVRVTVTVTDKDKSATPTIDQPTEGDDKITGKGEPGATIVVTDKDGNDIGTTTVKPDRTWEVKVPTNKPLNKGDKITATQTETGKKPSDPAKETVKGKVTPPSFNYLTLTLDENYRGGEITHHDVYEGDLIERYLYVPRRRGYVFEGWSYNSRRLDEVRPGDRIYYPTTLYAIWAKDRDYDRDEREEEPEDLRPVHDHNAYMFGYTDGTVRPNGKITRAEAAALVTRLLGLDTFASAAKPVFSDTPSSWYNKAINAAVQRGIMKGYPDGRFRPNAPITRAEFTQMISTIDNKPYGVAPFADVKGHWAERPIGSEYQAGRIMGYPDQTFRPNAFITRCEAVVILNKMFERNYDAMSLKDAKNAYLIKGFIDLPTSFWGYYDMIEATNSHSFKRRVKGKVQEDWTLVK